MRLEDYRDLQGRYDKLVSIEMIEAIGAPYLDTYFRTVDRLLKPEGLALIQAITIEDHRYAQALKAVDFIKRHVFPGSFIPSIHAMLAAKTRASASSEPSRLPSKTTHTGFHAARAARPHPRRPARGGGARARLARGRARLDER